MQKLVDGIIGPGGPWYAGEYLKWACRAGLDVSVIRGLAEEVDPHSEWEGVHRRGDEVGGRHEAWIRRLDPNRRQILSKSISQFRGYRERHHVRRRPRGAERAV